MIKIIVDSSCDMPEELMEEYNIKLLSQRIYLDGSEYFDKVTINAEEVYEAMSRGIVPIFSAQTRRYSGCIHTVLPGRE